jgi:hypothetical protein
MNFRNMDCIQPPDLSAGQLIRAPGEDYMLPAWYFYPVPVPNVGTGMLLKVRAPSISYAALASQPARVVNRPTCKN